MSYELLFEANNYHLSLPAVIQRLLDKTIFSVGQRQTVNEPPLDREDLSLPNQCVRYTYDIQLNSSPSQALNDWRYIDDHRDIYLHAITDDVDDLEIEFDDDDDDDDDDIFLDDDDDLLDDDDLDDDDEA